MMAAAGREQFFVAGDSFVEADQTIAVIMMTTGRAELDATNLVAAYHTIVIFAPERKRKLRHETEHWTSEGDSLLRTRRV